MLVFIADFAIINEEIKEWIVVFTHIMPFACSIL